MRRIISTGRASEMTILGLLLFVGVYGGAQISHWDGWPQKEKQGIFVTTYNPKSSVPPLNGLEPKYLKKTEPHAIAERAEAIRRTKTLLEAERDSHGGWDKWQKDTEIYRQQLQQRLKDLKEFPRNLDNSSHTQYEVLAGFNNFPLFEAGSREFLQFMCDPSSLDTFRHDSPVVVASKWLKTRNVDLIVAVVPNMVEVYAEHFIQGCPKDLVIAPHVRQALWEISNGDAEIIDGFALFRNLRYMDEREYLYNTADTHWAPRGMRIMAKAVADRIERYEFGARAHYAVPFTKVQPGPNMIQGHVGGIGDEFNEWPLLSPEQQELAKVAQTTAQAEVVMLDGRVPPDDPKSPVIVIGNSFVNGFKEQLVKELGLLVACRSSVGHTTQVFSDMLRETEGLEHAHVVVWVLTEAHIPRFKMLPSMIRGR